MAVCPEWGLSHQTKPFLLLAMKNALHTLGPWHRCNVLSDGSLTIAPLNDIGVPKATIASVRRPGTQEGMANARLIEAAPSLLRALRLVLKRYVDLVNCGDCGCWDPEVEDDVIEARAAIAKALGQEPSDGK